MSLPDLFTRTGTDRLEMLERNETEIAIQEAKQIMGDLGTEEECAAEGNCAGNEQLLNAETGGQAGSAGNGKQLLHSSPPTSSSKSFQFLPGYFEWKRKQIASILNPNGRYCSSMITDRTMFPKEQISPLELQVKWRKFLHQQTGIILLLRPKEPKMSDLAKILPPNGHPDEGGVPSAALYVRSWDNPETGETWMHEASKTVLE